MISSWSQVKLDELTEPKRRITYGVVKPGDEVDEGVKFVRGGDVFQGKIALDKLRTISPHLSQTYKRTILQGGELLMSLVGNPGEVAIAPLFLEGSNIARQVGLIALRSEIDARFVMYFLMSPIGRARLFTRTGGAVQQVINLADLRDIKIPVPSLFEQKRIAEILSAYDDLIENNLKRIRLLEESARLLYREWFVRLKFPNHEHTPLIDGLPEGWERKRFCDVAEITMGQSPESKFYNETGEGLPFHQGVTKFGSRFVTHEIYTTATNRIAQAGDILCSVRAPVGRLNITLDKIVIGRGLAAVRSKTQSQSFLYFQLKNFFFKDDLIGSGSIFASVTKTDLENAELINPSQNLIDEFQKISEPTDEQIRVLSLQNQKLKQARDLLLPRLMSGEIAV